MGDQRIIRILEVFIRLVATGSFQFRECLASASVTAVTRLCTLGVKVARTAYCTGELSACFLS